MNKGGKVRTRELCELGQSPWLDTIERRLVRSGELKRMVEEEGLRGMTSNPTIFDKAISQGQEYEADIQRLAAAGLTTFDIYDELTTTDVREAAAVFYPVYQESGGGDGYVSLEPPSQYAYDLEKTLSEVPRLFGKVGTANVMIKLPGTLEGVAALRQFIAQWININVTLLFSPANYAQVAQSYIAGLHDLASKGGELSRVASVASIFVSRIDTAVDKRLEELMAAEADPARRAELAGLRGRAAVANSKLIYQKYQELFASPDFTTLEARGARRQRVLWGSTGTKNPDYSDVKYIDELIGRGTVSTLPPETWRAFLDHGVVRETVTQGVGEARQVIQRLESLGISMEEVCLRLQQDGVAAFAASLDSLLASLEARRQAALAAR